MMNYLTRNGSELEVGAMPWGGMDNVKKWYYLRKRWKVHGKDRWKGSDIALQSTSRVYG